MEKLIFHFGNKRVEVVAPRLKDEGQEEMDRMMRRESVLFNCLMLPQNTVQVIVMTGIKDFAGEDIAVGDRVEFEYADRNEPEGKGKCSGIVTFERGCFCVREDGFDYEGHDELPMTLYEWCKDERCYRVN